MISQDPVDIDHIRESLLKKNEFPSLIVSTLHTRSYPLRPHTPPENFSDATRLSFRVEN